MTCVPPSGRSSSSACRSNADCPSGTLCSAGRCGQPCANSLQCPSSQECVEGICVPGGGGEPVVRSPLCGNRQLDAPEECDDGNIRDYDGCSQFCKLEVGYCGDGVVQDLLGEQCEPSLHDPALPYRCGANCRYQSDFCGNGVLNPGEECDDGIANADALPDRCRTDCSNPRCGDGTVDSAEQCDDGNRFDGDGCDRYCRRDSQAAGSVPGGVTPPPPGENGIGGPPPDRPLEETGPGVLVFMAAGAAAGYAWMRRKRK